MSDVQFDEQGMGPVTGMRADKPSAILSLALRMGLGKDAATAEKALIVVAVVAIIIAFFVFKNAGPEILPVPEPSLSFLS
jgi:hypothetical protein